MRLKFALFCLLLSPLCLGSATALAKGLCINEIQVSNLDQYVDPSWNYGAWIELFNNTDEDYQLRGLWVSDDPERLRKVRITQSIIVPAGGFRNLWFDHHDKYCLSQLQMKLDPEGGSLFLSTNASEIVAQVDYPPIAPRASYARTIDGVEEWALSSTPTPAASNEGMTFCEERLEAPVITKESQMFDKTMVFSVGIPSGCTLRYTTDGTTPTHANGKTSTVGYFSIDKTTVFRFALFRAGYLSSPVVTRSFIQRDKTFTLPVISLVTAPDNLESDLLGIFVRGTNGRPGRGQSTKCNWNMDWDRPCNFELLSAEGQSLINQETELSACGGWSRARIPHSFKVHATKYYEGQKTLDYPFFSAKPYLKHKMLQIRNGGNDNSCRVKDAFLQQVVATSGLDVDYQEYQPVVHYINGVYKGTINMREPNNKHHVYANYGLDDDEIDLFEIDPDSGYVQMCGTNAAWKKLYNYSRLVASQRYYEMVREMVDLEEMCNYLAIEFYLGSTDWPQNNLKAFRPIAEGGRFRFILFDVDHSFNTTSPFSLFAGKKTHTFNVLYGEDVSRYTKEIEIVTIFLALLNNNNFRKLFIDTFCLVAGSVFEPSRCEELMKKMAERVYDMQILPDNGYGSNTSPWGTTNSMISSLRDRQAPLIAALKEYSSFRLSSVTGQEIELSSNIPTAKLQVNEIVVPTGRFSGTLFPPITLKASAPQGYRFLGWHKITSDEPGSQQIQIERGSAWRYYDRGLMTTHDWTQLSYSDVAWGQGNAPLGYGNVQTYATTISFGSNTEQKRPTYYFRKSITLEDEPDDDAKFILNYYLDDGMVVYVNGEEAGRYNMPSGEITGSTFSVTYAGNDPFAGSIELDHSLFHKGRNVIAVEVHNNSNTSSDIYWDASLTVQSTLHYEEVSDYLSTEAQMPMPAESGRVKLVACFEKLPQDEHNPIKPVVLNEVSAANSIYVNEYFKKNDWIELYNMTSQDIDLEGYYLSDDPKNPRLCRIEAGSTSASTILPARGYKIIWCDRQPITTQLHVDFKLANEDGAMVLLTAPDLSYTDTLVYCQHDGLQTVGRFPDGGKDVFLMTKPTIEKENAMNSYTKLIDMSGTSDSGNAIETARVSGLSIAFSDGDLRIKDEDRGRVAFHVYSVSGTLVMNGEVEVENVHAHVSLSPLMSGVYVAKVEDSNGNVCSVKFRK